MPPCGNQSGEVETFMLDIILVGEHWPTTSSETPVSMSKFSAAGALVAGTRAGDTG